jgi:dynein heavy chain
MSVFRSKGHNLLEFEKTLFDKDYVEWNVDISKLDAQLQKFIDNNFK